ncbi:MAG TPA: ACT domain-containing protein [Candidatus Limnocylindrales bacterium]
MTVWFTVQLDDQPGSLARVANALAERGVNITGIVGVAEDTDGALMLTTSDPVATRAAFEALGLPFEEHDPTGGIEPDRMSVADLRPSRGA